MGSIFSGGSGGGTSTEESEPAYQEGVQSTGKRTIPDVSSDGNPATGVAVYDASNGGWQQVGGTSVACPTWAGYIAIADQGRALVGTAPLTGYNQTLPALYSIPYTDFNDVTVGQNASDNLLFDQYLYRDDDPGYQAKPGYDEVTGLGSPKADLLVPDLAAYGIGSKLAVTTEPPASVISGDGFGLTVTLADSFGNTDTSYDGTATLSLSANPGNASFSAVTVPIVNGTAVFDNLSLTPVAQGYQFQVSVTGFTSQTTSTINVIANPTPLAGSLYPATSDASLRSAIDTADTNSFASNTIYLEAGAYTLTNASLGQLVINDTANGVSSKTLTIIGQGAGSTIIEPSLDAGFGSRVFEVVSKTGATVTVVFQDLTISGGYAANGGVLGGKAALGGGLLIDGGKVSLTNVDLIDNVAGGAVGALGATGSRGAAGKTGGAGGAARGGAFYLAGGGNLSLNDTEISQNIAWGGVAGSGGMGGEGFGSGGKGGSGGAASGGAGYVASGSISGSSNIFQSNAALGGKGGSGGFGGTGSKDNPGGRGGNGGDGGSAVGAGILVASGSIDLGATSLDSNLVQGGSGGYGALEGVTKAVTSDADSEIIGFKGGTAGNGGNAAGGGLYLFGGTVNLSGGSHGSNLDLGGSAGISGNLALYLLGFTSGYGVGSSGFSDGGGIYVNGGSLTMANVDISRNIASNGGGLANGTSGSVNASHGEFSGNQANYGGGLLNFGTFKLDGGVVAVNSAYSGGGIYNNGDLYLTGVSVINNTAYSGAGGGIDNTVARSSASSVTRSGQVHASNLDISANTAKVKGGGIYSYQGSLSITGVSEVEYNKVESTGTSKGSNTVGIGGGLGLNGGTAGIKISISGATVAYNSAQFGGGIFVSNGNVTIGGGTITGNSAVNGGGIDNNASLTLNNLTISGNTASSDGGGIDNTKSTSLTLDDVTISGNKAGANGGGIFNPLTLTIDNAQIVGNTAGLSGGGIQNSGSLTVTNSTLSGNVAVGVVTGSTTSGGDGGAIYNLATLTIVNTTAPPEYGRQRRRPVYGQRGEGGCHGTHRLRQRATIRRWRRHLRPPGHPDDQRRDADRQRRRGDLRNTRTAWAVPSICPAAR